MRSIGPKLPMKTSKVVYETVELVSTHLWPWKSGLKIQIFDVKNAILKSPKKPAFSVISHTPGFPKIPALGVIPMHPMPRKLMSRLSGLTPPSRILDLVPWKLYFGNRIFTIFQCFHFWGNFSWKKPTRGSKYRTKSNFPKCPSKLFCLPLDVPNTPADSLRSVWVPLEHPCVG